MEAKGTRRADLEARKGQDKWSEKTSGHATTSGQDYEVALCCLVFLRALRVTSDFFLLSNFAPAGNLDDVVLFYRMRGDPKYSAVLVQAKYREKPRRKKLTKSNPFSLAKYSASFAGFRALCAGGVPLEGGLLEVGEVSTVLYSNDGCDFDGVARDVTAQPDMELLQDFLDTGGRLLRVTDAPRLGLSEDFADSLTLCTEQTSLDEADGHLERELRALLALTSAADVVELRTRLWEGVKRWWSMRGENRRLTAKSPEWTDVLRLLVAHLNGPRLNLDFSPEALAVVRCALEHELTWITVADERQARATRGRLLQALGGSCLLEAGARLLAWDQVEALWGTVACPTLALDLSSAGSPPAWSQLLGAVRSHKRLAVLALHGTPQTPPEAQWYLFQAEPTWSVLDGATKDRLLVAEVSLQGRVVALRDVLGGYAPSGMSDEVISALCDPVAAAVLRLGFAPDSSSPENYVHRCLQRTVVGDINWADLRKTKALVFSNIDLSKYTFNILDLKELEKMTEIAKATLVRVVPSHSGIRNECCRLSVRGVSKDLWEWKVTEFVPLSWLCEDRVVIVEGVAGVGKSTFVTMMCSKVKQRFPASWVLRFDLAKHTDFIRRGDFGDIPGFLLRSLPEERQSLLRELLEHSLYVAGNVFLFVDAFDEISPDYTAQCCQLLQGIISAVKFHQMVVTTRSVNTKDVEKALDTKAFSLPVFSDDEQDIFLERFYKSKDMLVDRSTISSLREAAGPVLEVPLLCRMAAEVLLLSDDQNVLRYKNPWSKVLLYERFVEQTTVSRQAEKVDILPTLHGKRLLKTQAKEHLRNLQAMAVKTLFPEVKLPNFVLSSELPDEKLGLVKSDGTTVDFEHRTFAEFFLGRWLAQHWEQCPQEPLRDLLARKNSEFVAATMSWSLFEDSQPHLAVARGEEVRSETTDRGGRTALHVAAMTTGGQLPEVSAEVLDKVLGATAARCAEIYKNWQFLDALTVKGKTLEGTRFLTDPDAAWKVHRVAIIRDLPGLLNVILRRHRGLRELRLGDMHNSLLHEAATFGSVNVIRYLLMEQPRHVDVEKGDGETPLHSAARWGCVQAVTFLLDKGAEINKQNGNGGTAMMLAARVGHVEVVKVLLEKGGDANIQNEDGNTALMYAAHGGHVEVVKLLIEKGAYTNIEDKYGNTAMMLAARKCHMEVVKVMLDKRSNTNIQDERSKIAIMEMMEAAYEGHMEMVKEFVEKGAYTNIQDEHVSTAMMLATGRGHVGVVKVLLEKGGDTNIRDKHVNTVMMDAAREGHVEVVNVLLEKGGNADIQNEDGKTALMLAARRGHVDVVKVLLEKGVDTNIQDKRGNTALMDAARGGHVKVVKLLLKTGVDTNIQDERGNTAMILAAYEGHVEVVKVLASGADTSIQDEHGFTAMMDAASRGHVDVVKVLLERGADTNIQDKRGNTAMMDSARRGHVDVVNVMLEKGADTNIQDEHGNTALMFAAREGHVEVVAVLLEKGADTNTQDERGNTAMMHGARGGHFDVVNMLLENGADTDIQDKRGNTAIMHAARGGHLKVVKVLSEKGADTNLQDKRGNTAIMFAACGGHVEVLVLLLEKGADTNIQNKRRNTALMLAAQRGHVNVVEVLRERP